MVCGMSEHFNEHINNNNVQLKNCYLPTEDAKKYKEAYLQF